jgi:hypothetical protein
MVKRTGFNYRIFIFILFLLGLVGCSHSSKSEFLGFWKVELADTISLDGQVKRPNKLLNIKKTSGAYLVEEVMYTGINFEAVDTPASLKDGLLSTSVPFGVKTYTIDNDGRLIGGVCRPHCVRIDEKAYMDLRKKALEYREKIPTFSFPPPDRKK